MELSSANYSSSNYQTGILSINFRTVSPYQFDINKSNNGWKLERCDKTCSLCDHFINFFQANSFVAVSEGAIPIKLKPTADQETKSALSTVFHRNLIPYDPSQCFLALALLTFHVAPLQYVFWPNVYSSEFIWIIDDFWINTNV